jgi:alpha-glucuronidase
MKRFWAMGLRERLPALLLAMLVGSIACTPAKAEDGYRLWLRYPAVASATSQIIVPSRSAMIDAAVAELERGLAGRVPRVALAIAADPQVTALSLPTRDLGEEGYLIRSVTLAGQPTILVTSATDRGLLYGAFALLRHLDSGGTADAIALRSTPRIRHRILNHWDNLDGFVERGYAGQSLWDWGTLPDYRDPLYTDYARANASIGINGTVLNNVNAKSDSLTAPYLAKAAALADMFRPYGIRVYLSARWTAPVDLGGLKTGDPLDPQVAAWWKAKADEIYRLIPDFGGFLVKANSEGQPGPGDYGRTHAEGANMLAAALAPHGGIVMWRAFVYADTNPEDRAKQAYSEFKPLDGRFASNVVVQVKNGAIDFQPREPFHPLFGAMPKTPLFPELQITKEYLGQGTSLAYLAPLFEEVLDADTMAKGKGTTVARIADGSAEGHRLTGLVGVANIGRARDWTGSSFNQANWYAFGRLAWDSNLSSLDIAREWVAQTFTTERPIVNRIVEMMMGSREAVVNYTGALGLAHLMGTGHHYGPAPWVADLGRPEWNPAYYHRADREGIGFDRTASGSNAISQYAPPVAARYARPETTPVEQLLWFHHLPWSYEIRGGMTVWHALLASYDAGVAQVRKMRESWEMVQDHIDRERWQKIDALLAIETRDAQLWRDASIAYWMSINGLALPPWSAPPRYDLDWYKAQKFPYAPGNP